MDSCDVAWLLEVDFLVPRIVEGRSIADEL